MHNKAKSETIAIVSPDEYLPASRTNMHVLVTRLAVIQITILRRVPITPDTRCAMYRSRSRVQTYTLTAKTRTSLSKKNEATTMPASAVTTNMLW